jgi:cytochrome c-type biogenesis protein CcsB
MLLLLTTGAYAASSASYVGYLIWQRERLYAIAQAMLAAGLLLHTLAVAAAFIQSGHAPVANLRETLILAAWAVTGVFLSLQVRLPVKVLGAYAAPLATLIMVVGLQLPEAVGTDRSVLASVWLALHVITIFTGEAAFALACGLAVVYLVQEHAIKNKRHGFFYRRLPALERIDTAAYRCIAAGFSLHSLGLVTGFIYAHVVWGRMWSWDPKEVWAGVTWLLYAALLHQRLTVGWRGRRAAVMAIIGFAVVLFTFLGVNFLMQGHHGVFTGG